MKCDKVSESNPGEEIEILSLGEVHRSVPIPGKGGFSDPASVRHDPDRV